MVGFLPKERKEKKDMLNRDKIIIISFILLFANCLNDVSGDKKFDLYQKSISIVSKEEYSGIYSKMNDSLKIWVLNRLMSYEAEYTYNYKLDSLLCFNKKGNKVISCIHVFGNQFGSRSDDLIWFYGEKIKDKWYFFQGDDLILSRSAYKKDVENPLTYNELHAIALKNIYAGYLKNNGEINEAWFTSHFENAGWCGTCKTTEDFQKSRLENVKTLWLQRDTSQPIKQLPSKTTLP